MTSITLKHILKITGDIEVVTGLHIGANRGEIEIGGLDNPVLKNPVNGEPYIPGSSLKGKMRSLLEAALGRRNESNPEKVHECGEAGCPVCRIFGSTQYEADTSPGPTRIIVRDATLNRASTAAHFNFPEGEKFAVNEILEEKTENMINRILGKAEHPRQQERVAPGSRFAFEILFKIYDVDGDGGAADEKLFEKVREIFKLLELDYLGGSGTRGYGQVRIHEGETQTIDLASQLAEV